MTDVKNPELDSILSVDWVKYLERKRLFFIYFCFVEIESKQLFDVTGFKFSHYLYTYIDDLGSHYRSAGDLVKSDAHYISLVESNDKNVQARLLEWRDLGLKWNKRADELAIMFKDRNFTSSVNSDEFRKYFNEFLQILLYGVTVPYLILTAINTQLEKGVDKKKYQQIIDAFEPLRGVSKYPQLEDTMMEHFFNIAAIKLGLSDEQKCVIHSATPMELDLIFANKPSVSTSELIKRSKWCVFWKNTNDLIEFSYDESILMQIPILSKKKPMKLNQIKGSIAYKGKVIGRVCVVNAPRDMSKFKAGDIIVSNCTNPSLMPVIAICSGIITDEGGIMCHAAIVSRELKKPCIIGTKVATHVLCDGDIIELDAVNGIITKQNK